MRLEFERAFHLFQRAEITVSDFEHIIHRVQPKDFVFLNPPWLKRGITTEVTDNNITNYLYSQSYSTDDQSRLFNLCYNLHSRGVYFTALVGCSSYEPIFSDFRLEQCGNKGHSWLFTNIDMLET